MDTVSDTIMQIKKGNQAEFKKIIQEFGPMVRAYLSGHLSDFRDIEELSQEIFVAVYWNLETFNPELSFRAWVKAIARNKMLSHLRKHYSQKNMVNRLREEIIEQLPAPSLAPNHKTESVLKQLNLCLGKQSGSTAKLVEARYFKREPVIQIAKRLKTTEDAISSRLYRIRNQLKKCIEQGLVP
ncbi:RNA polymerase sigma factor [Pontiella agarivorans]|uniref:Sigma-70 family RNA polymerase sigma factor n=1 Tax=Pontiella agarivorans TaxID=3038953 RepID=A0ABU5MWF3_9BACT|nr:sigma-70 family RNA polymerase sigma factor [Pontiella agarivorans]MDZ8118468.1 sigma-70 family RNA polymerase sigma factor [Pontiella agarivorans]